MIGSILIVFCSVLFGVCLVCFDLFLVFKTPIISFFQVLYGLL